MFTLRKYFFTFLAAIFISTMGIAQPANWSYAITADNHTILVQAGSVLINGTSIDIGDYIGVFYENNGNLYCAGYKIWNGTSNAVTAWGDETSVPGKNGFDTGEIFKWKIWDTSANMEFNASVTYMTSLPNQGTYFPNGLSGVATVMGSTSIIPAITETSCYGLSDGAIDITIVSGTAPFTFYWSTGATTQNLNNLPAGTYNITVTDSFSISSSLTIEVTQPDELTANILANENSAFMCMATAEVFPTGGTGPYSYLWNTIPTQTTQQAELCPGLFIVTITDSNNCQTNLGVIVDPTSINVIDSAFTLIDTCIVTTLPDTAYISNLLYSSGTMIIQWTLEFGSSSIVLDSYYPGFTSPGLYYVGLVINCPTKSFNSLTFVDIYNIPAFAEISGSSNETSCPGICDGSINIVVTSGTPPYSYLWSNGETTQNINSLCEGYYSVTVTDASGSNSTVSYIISDPSNLEVNESITNLICNNVCDGSIDITVSGGNPPYSFSWSNGEAVPNLSNLCATDYNLTVTDSNGCISSNNYTLSQPTAIQEVISIVDASCSCCNDGIIDLTTDGGIFPYSFIWSNGEMTEDINNLYAGVYEVTITDANGCVKTSIFEVNGPAPVALTANTSDISCYGLSDGSISILVAGGIPPYNYTWSNGGSSESIVSLNAGTYEITITDSIGCNTTSSFVITQPDLLELNETTLDASSFGVCDGSIDVTVLGGISPYTFIWSNTEITEDIGNLCAGIYTVTVSDINNCSQNQTYTVGEPSGIIIMDNGNFTCTIHPNPILDNLHLYILNANSNYLNVEIYNSIGSKIFEVKTEISNKNTMEINIPNLSPGIYIAKVFQDKQSAILKFIK